MSLAKYYHSYEFSIIGRVLTPPWVGGGYAHRAHRESMLNELVCMCEEKGVMAYEIGGLGWSEFFE